MKQLLMVSFLAICLGLQSQTSLPMNVKVQLPSYISNQNEVINSEWINLIKSSRYGTPKSSFWEVYSDREDNQTYTSPQIGSPFKKLHYGQKLIIADIQNNFALVYEEGEYQQIPPKVNGETMGWISIDNLLLWDKCPMDDNKVFKKAVVLFNLDANKKGDLSPDFLSNPYTKQKTGKAANKLEFYFIMKTTIVNGELFYLLSKNWSIGNSIGGVNNLYGWISEGNVSTWNNRLCFEPNWDSKAVNEYNLEGIKPMVLKSVEDAQLYKSRGVIDKNQTYWIDEEFSIKRKNPQLIRLPLISEGYHQLPRGIYKVASIGQLGSKIKNNGKIISEDDRAKIERELQDLIVKRNNINIIFVVDGSFRMSKYYRPIADAIDLSMRKEMKNSYKFGAVVYRDYSDGNKIIEKTSLNADYERVSNFLNNCEIEQSNRVNNNLQGTMFHGLESAIELLQNKDDESNFIFLIGDCGNLTPDPKGKNVNTIIDAMVDKRINLLAFQANNSDNKAYNEFILQAKKIITKTIEGITKKTDSYGSIEMKLNSRGLYKTSKIGNPTEQTPIVEAYTFCNPNERKEPKYLESLVEDMIKEYDLYVSSRIIEIQNYISGSNSQAIGTIPDAVREEFKLRWGWTDDEINSLKGEEQLKIAGYTCDKPGNKNNDIFVPVLFISHEEYITLMKSLKKLKSNEFVNNRTAYYEAVKSLALLFFGNINIEQIEIETLMAQMYGIPTKFKPTMLNGVKIIDILEPKRVSQDQLNEFIDNFNSRLPNLEKIQGDKSYQFLSNNIVYYWIPVDELP